MGKPAKSALHIRPGKPRDLEAWDRIDVVCFPDLVASGHVQSVAESDLFESALLNRQRTRWVLQVAELNKRVVGYAYGLPVGHNTNSRYLNLDLIAVLPEARSEGVGSSLIQAASAEAKRAGYHFVVAKTKAQTLSFFESNGFTLVPRDKSLAWSDPVRNSMLMPGEASSDREEVMRFDPDEVTGNDRLVYRALRDVTHGSPREISAGSDNKV